MFLGEAITDSYEVIDSPVQPKRGRRAKAGNADRVQVSVYLSRDVYEG